MNYPLPLTVLKFNASHVGRAFQRAAGTYSVDVNRTREMQPEAASNLISVLENRKIRTVRKLCEMSYVIDNLQIVTRTRNTLEKDNF